MVARFWCGRKKVEERIDLKAWEIVKKQLYFFRNSVAF